MKRKKVVKIIWTVISVIVALSMVAVSVGTMFY